MLAAVVKGVNQINLENVLEPQIKDPMDVVLRVTATAICTSDVHIVEGYFPPSPPYVIGHEFIGIIEEAGTGVTAFKKGDRVAVPPAPYCGKCSNCRNGLFGQCQNSAIFGSGCTWGNLPGGLAEYVRVPYADNSLTAIPEEISDEQAILIGDMLTTGYYAVENCVLSPGDTVAVFGAGPVGLCAVHTARLFSPARIILVDLLPNRLEIGKKMGATDIINSAWENAVDIIMEITNGIGVSAAIEAIGNPATVNDASQVVRVGGILSIVGLFPGPIEFPIHNLLMKNVAVKMGLANLGNIHRLINLVSYGKLDTSPLITHRMPFKDFEKAYEIFAGKKENVIKILLQP